MAAVPGRSRPHAAEMDRVRAASALVCTASAVDFTAAQHDLVDAAALLALSTDQRLEALEAISTWMTSGAADGTFTTHLCELVRLLRLESEASVQRTIADVLGTMAPMDLFGISSDLITLVKDLQCSAGSSAGACSAALYTLGCLPPAELAIHSRFLADLTHATLNDGRVRPQEVRGSALLALRLGDDQQLFFRRISACLVECSTPSASLREFEGGHWRVMPGATRVDFRLSSAVLDHLGRCHRIQRIFLNGRYTTNGTDRLEFGTPLERASWPLLELSESALSVANHLPTLELVKLAPSLLKLLRGKPKGLARSLLPNGEVQCEITTGPGLDHLVNLFDKLPTETIRTMSADIATLALGPPKRLVGLRVLRLVASRAPIQLCERVESMRSALCTAGPEDAFARSIKVVLLDYGQAMVKLDASELAPLLQHSERPQCLEVGVCLELL